MKLRCSQFDKILNTFDDIEMMLQRQHLYITKMVMLIFSIIAVCSHLYSVCLICLVLKSSYFKELFSVVASKYSICDIENNKKSDNLTQNIFSLFQVLVQFLFTSSEKEIDYYHQKVNVRNVSRVAERFKTGINAHGIFADKLAWVPTQEKKRLDLRK